MDKSSPSGTHTSTFPGPGISSSCRSPEIIPRDTRISAGANHVCWDRNTLVVGVKLDFEGGRSIDSGLDAALRGFSWTPMAKSRVRDYVT